ncbi:hypothetical protein P8605_12860 [Streptomyces sp. T-3]|nr:hypothetical protein [Streptomyces sp. T-3]
MRAALQPVLEAGVTQRALASSVHVVPSTVTRYLNGERIAPQGFVDQCAAFLEEQGIRLSGEERERLHSLRRAAQAASTSAETRLLHAKEELEQLKTALQAAHRGQEASTTDAVQRAVAQAQQEGDRQLAGIENQLRAEQSELVAEIESVRHELAAQREQVRAAEAGRDALLVRSEAQQRRLEQARDVLKKTTADLAQREQQLAAREEQLRLQQHETRVLRRQIQRLMGEETPVAGATTQVTADVATVPPAARSSSGTADGIGASPSGSVGARRPVQSPRAQPKETKESRPALVKRLRAALSVILAVLANAQCALHTAAYVAMWHSDAAVLKLLFTGVFLVLLGSAVMWALVMVLAAIIAPIEEPSELWLPLAVVVAVAALLIGAVAPFVSETAAALGEWYARTFEMF